jgi:hypothetical protein
MHPEHVGPRLHQRVLALAAHHPRGAHHHRSGGPDAETAAHAGSAAAGVEPRRVHARREPCHPAPGLGRESRFDPVPAPLADVGQHVDRVPDVPQQTAGAGQPGPPHLVAVGEGDDAPGTCSTQPRCEQSQRRSGTEQHPVAAVAGQHLHDAPADRRRGKQDATGVAVDGKLQARVEGPVPGHRRGVDHHLVGRHPLAQREDEGLDAAATGREVVGDDQDPAHRAASRRRSARQAAVNAASSVPSTARIASATDAPPSTTR